MTFAEDFFGVFHAQASDTTQHAAHLLATERERGLHQCTEVALQASRYQRLREWFDPHHRALNLRRWMKRAGWNRKE